MASLTPKLTIIWYATLSPFCYVKLDNIPRKNCDTLFEHFKTLSPNVKKLNHGTISLHIYNLKFIPDEAPIREILGPDLIVNKLIPNESIPLSDRQECFKNFLKNGKKEEKLWTTYYRDGKKENTYLN